MSALLGATLSLGSLADSDEAAKVDRVGFPKDYAARFSVLRTVERDHGAKLVTVYGNEPAASVTNKAQLPYPFGSVLVMETATTRKDDKGQLKKDAVSGLHVMRKERNFGKQYGDKRSGEWDFVEYKPNGAFITPPEKSAACAECHIKAGSEKDFVYHARFQD